MYPPTVSITRPRPWRIAAAIWLALAQGAQARGPGPVSLADAGEAYRCAVLGEAQACQPTPPAMRADADERLEPGPLALYLMHVGMERSAALEQARSAGELPTRPAARITRAPLSGEALYRRAVGTCDGADDRLEAVRP